MATSSPCGSGGRRKQAKPKRKVFCDDLPKETKDELKNLKNTIKQKIYNKITQFKADGIQSEPLISQNGLNIITNDGVNIDENDMHSLANKIKQKVYKELAPVFGLRLIYRMKNGVGGVTIVTFSDDKQFILKNNKIYECTGIISDSDGSCSEQVKKFQTNEPQDFCYLRSYAEIEGQVCLSDSPLQTQTCSLKKEPVLSVSREEYNALCGDKVDIIKYKYIADRNSKKHVKIPNENVKCDNQEEGVCEFTVENERVSEWKTGALLNNVNI